MGTPGAIGRVTADGRWEAVRVEKDGYPDGLGATLVQAVADHGLPAVLEQAFSTRGWSCWPLDPHHPEDPEDHWLTPENIWEDCWFYLFDEAAGTLEVRATLDTSVAPSWRVRLETLTGDELGPAESMPLPTVRSCFDRRCRPAHLGPITELLALLGRPEGMGVETRLAPTNRHLWAGEARIDLPTRSFAGHHFFGPDGHPLGMPDGHGWFRPHGALLQRLAKGTGFTIDSHDPPEVVWTNLFEALFAEAIPLDGSPPPAERSTLPLPLAARALAAVQGDSEALLRVLDQVLVEQHPGADIEAWCENGVVGAVRWRSVVESVDDPHRELDAAMGRALDPACAVGDVLGFPLDPGDVAAMLGAAERVLGVPDQAS